MAPTVAGSYGVRHLIDRVAAVDTSAADRAFRAHTAGLGLRLPLPGLNDMRAGKRLNPLAAITRYLEAGRYAGLDRAWAEQVLAFADAEIERIYCHALPPLPQARLSATKADAAEEVAEAEAHAGDDSLAALEREERLVRVDIAAETVRLTALQREIGRRKSGAR